jgi:hypothetical protein
MLTASQLSAQQHTQVAGKIVDGGNGLTQLQDNLEITGGSIASSIGSGGGPVGIFQNDNTSLDGDSLLDSASGSNYRYKIFDLLNPDLYLSVCELASFNHDKHEICYCCLSRVHASSTSTRECEGRNMDDPVEVFRYNSVVYLGSTTGTIFRFSFNKVKSSNNNRSTFIEDSSIEGHK